MAKQVQTKTKTRTRLEDTVRTCGCGNTFTPGSGIAKYCPACKSAGKNKPRVKTKLQSTIRVMKGVNLNLNIPLFKL